MHPSADHLKSIYNIYTTPVGPQNAYSENKTTADKMLPATMLHI